MTLTAEQRATVEEVFVGWSAREAMMFATDLCITIAWRFGSEWQTLLLDHLAISLLSDHRGAIENRKHWRVRPMNVDEMVDRWHRTMRQLSTGHSHATFTEAEFSSDDLLLPILTAPIAQLREFAARLAAELEADEAVPFMVWSSFKEVVLPLILTRPEGEVLKLKSDLAREIAELTADDIPREDLISAIASALQWRSSGLLERLRDNAQAAKAAGSGASRPRMTGRQSCLFLTVGDAQVIL